MPDEEYKEKIKDFVDHLLNIPNIRDEPLLIGEGLILNFIAKNQDQLKVTFKTPQYFPDMKWEEILKMLVSELYERVSKDTLPLLTQTIESIDLEVLNKIEGSSYPPDFHREKLLALVQSVFMNKDARYNYNSIVNILQNQIVDKYLTEIFKRREVVYNEIVRVQKTYLECDEYVNYLKILMLIKNASYIKIPFGSGSKVNLFDSLKMPGKMPKFLNEASLYFRQQAPNITERTLALAFKSNLKSDLTDIEDASSRLIFIMCARFHNYKPVKVVDRGAESPDKSWFAVARKNSDYYGFDKRMLDALYRIAGDNNW